MRDGIFENWKKWRAEGVKVPSDFGNRIMEQIAAREMRSHCFSAWITLVALPRVGRVAICLLAGLVGLVRMTQVMGALIP